MNDAKPSLLQAGLLAPVFLPVYLGLLYFQLATAALDDRHAAGIGALQWVASPGLLLALLVLAGIASRREGWLRSVQRCAVLALIGGALLGMFVVTQIAPGDAAAVLPAGASLGTTLRAALLAPRFSSEAFGATIVSEFAALFWFMVAGWAARRMRLQAGDPGRFRA